MTADPATILDSILTAARQLLLWQGFAAATVKAFDLSRRVTNGAGYFNRIIRRRIVSAIVGRPFTLNFIFFPMTIAARLFPRAVAHTAGRPPAGQHRRHRCAGIGDNRRWMVRCIRNGRRRLCRTGRICTIGMQGRRVKNRFQDFPFSPALKTLVFSASITVGTGNPFPVHGDQAGPITGTAGIKITGAQTFRAADIIRRFPLRSGGDRSGCRGLGGPVRRRIRRHCT